MKIKFKEIKKHEPCTDGWKLLLRNTNPEMDMEKEIDLMEILESNGIKDAVWALRTQEYRDECLFRADVAESVLHIFEEKYPKDDRPRKAIEAVRKWYAGEITDEELFASAAAAASAYSAAAYAYTSASAAAYAYASASVASAASAYSASAYAYASASAAAAASASAAAYAYASASAYSAAARKWAEIEKIFIKHFGGLK